MTRNVRMLGVLALALGLVGCDAMTSHTGVVARVGEHELTVDEAVELMAGNPRIPAQAEVVESVADLWVDYTILATLAARDSLLSDLDLGDILTQYVEQRTFQDLREQVVSSDTAITEEELRTMFETGNPALQVRARHILVGYPEGATEAQRDSVRELADSLRERAVSGEDFAELAGRHSADQGTARQGGDLGWFGADQMVKPFEDAAFALQPGEISPVTETLYGLHIIKVEERQSPSYDEMGPEFRERAVAQRQAESLEAYVASLTEPADLEIQRGGTDVARDLAGKPSTRLAGRAASRELVTWRGGRLTAGEFLHQIQRRPPQARAGIAAMEDQQLESVLTDLATNELVLQDAQARGIAIPQEEQDSIMGLIREQVVDVARQAGLIGRPQEGETQSEAIDRRVRALLQGVLSGQQPMLPLGALPYVLREEMEWNVFSRTFPAVTAQLEEHREGQGAQQPAPQFPMPQGGGQQPPPQPDTAAR